MTRPHYSDGLLRHIPHNHFQDGEDAILLISRLHGPVSGGAADIMCAAYSAGFNVHSVAL